MSRAWLCALLIALLALGAIMAGAEETDLPLPVETGDGIDAAEGVPTLAVAFDAQSAGYAGIWVPFEDGFQLYMPAAWRAVELTDAQREAGLFYRAGGDGEGVAVGYAPAGALKSMDDLQTDYRGAGFADLVRLSLNGIDAIGFTRPEAGYRGVAFFHPTCPGYVMTIYFAPLDAQTAPARSVLASLSPWSAAPEG